MKHINRTICVVSMAIIGCCMGAVGTVYAQQTLDVPFIPQSPEHEWIEPWNNACEESALAMVDIYYDEKEREKQTDSIEYGDIEEDSSVQKKIILDMIGVKEQKNGKSADEFPEQLAAIVNEYFDWRATVVDYPQKEDIIDQLEKNQPIIIPLYGQVMNKGQFSAEGPDYHVAVIIGYDKATNNFILNDPGSVHDGKEIYYDADTLLGESQDALVNNGYLSNPQVLFTHIEDGRYAFVEEELASENGTHSLKHNGIFPKPLGSLVKTVVTFFEEILHGEAVKA